MLKSLKASSKISHYNDKNFEAKKYNEAEGFTVLRTMVYNMYIIYMHVMVNAFLFNIIIKNLSIVNLSLLDVSLQKSELSRL